jgi:mono/diheme cytochrome c family protein
LDVNRGLEHGDAATLPCASRHAKHSSTSLRRAQLTTRRADPTVNRFAAPDRALLAGATPTPFKESLKMSLRDPLRAVSMALVVFAVSAAVIGTAVAASTAATPAAKPTPATGDAKAGQAIFKVKCVACHKVDGTGGFKVTGNPTPNWTLKKTWDATRTDAYLRDCITNGKTKSGMVAWVKSGVLKPTDAENLIAYIKTFKAAAK